MTSFWRTESEMRKFKPFFYQHNGVMFYIKTLQLFFSTHWHWQPDTVSYRKYISNIRKKKLWIKLITCLAQCTFYLHTEVGMEFWGVSYLENFIRNILTPSVLGIILWKLFFPGLWRTIGQSEGSSPWSKRVRQWHPSEIPRRTWYPRLWVWGPAVTTTLRKCSSQTIPTRENSAGHF